MQKKFNEKQIRILDIAEELIAKKGFEGTSIRDISSKANINVAMISYYFGSKEKMMLDLYEHRVTKTKEKFSEFTQTIHEGKPEMQIKEINRFIITQLLQYKHFHGFVTQELRQSKSVKNILTDFYLLCVKILNNIIEKGISQGVFKNACHGEDLLSTIVGTVLFVIRNREFYENFLTGNAKDLPSNTQNKLIDHLENCIFSILGHDPSHR